MTTLQHRLFRFITVTNTWLILLGSTRPSYFTEISSLSFPTKMISSFIYNIVQLLYILITKKKKQNAFAKKTYRLELNSKMLIETSIAVMFSDSSVIHGDREDQMVSF